MLRPLNTVIFTAVNYTHTGFCKVREKLRTSKAITLAFLFAVVCLLTPDAKAQGAAEAQAKEGTYQLMFPSRGAEKNVTLSPTQLAAVESLRRENETVYAVSISNDYIQVKILPRNQVNAAGFKPGEKVIFKQEMNYEEVQAIRYIEMP